MLERINRRRVTSSSLPSKYSKKCCEKACLLIITAMNLIGVIVLIILFACHKAQEFRRNPPIFTSTLSFENFPHPFPSTHFTRLTSDATHQLLRTEFFENHRLPAAILIFSDNLRTAPCCEIGTQLTPAYEEEFTNSEPSPPSFTPPVTYEIEPTQYTDNIYPTITVPLPPPPTTASEDQMNDYFTGWAVTLPPINSVFTKEKVHNEKFTGKLPSKKLISNQIDRIVAPPSIAPTTMESFEGSDNGLKEEGKKATKIGPPSTAPNEAELKILNEKEELNTHGINDYAENIVTDRKVERTKPSKLMNDNKESTVTAPTQSTTKTASTINNVLMGIPKGTTAIFLDCSTEKNQHSSHSCQAWKAAGYCNGHTATKYIFCRYQCLCASL